MATENYIVIYDASSAIKAASDVDSYTTALLKLETVADRLGPKLKSFAKGVSPGINQLTKSLQPAVAAMAALDARATSATSSARRFGSAATYAAGGATKVSTAAGNAARGFSNAATNAQRAATQINSMGAAAAAAAPGLTAAANAASALRASSAGAATSTKAVGSAMGGIATRVVAMQAARAMVHGLAEAMNDARDYAVDTAKELTSIRDSVRELRAIRGDKTTTDQAVAGVVDLMLASGATSKEAIDFETMWESAIPAARQNLNEETGKANWQLDDKQTQEAKTQALQFAVANGIDPATMGRMIPSIGIGQEIKTPAELTGQLSAMHAMAVQGVGKFGPILKVYNKLRPTMVRPEGGGATKSSAELLGLISAQTVTAGKEAQVTQDINQVWRELSVASNPEKSETFQKLGIRPGKDDYARSVEKLAPLLIESRKAGKSDLDTLAFAGFRNMGANAKIVAAVNNRAVIRARVDAVAKLADPGRVDAINEQFQRDNPQRFADAAGTAADLKRGEGMLELNPTREFARAGLARNREIDTVGSSAAEMFGTAATLGGILGEKGRPAHLDREVRSRLRAAVPGIEGRFPSLGTGRDLGMIIDPAGTRAFGTAEGEELSSILKGLTPAEKAAFRAEMESYARTGIRGGRLPARRAGPGPAGGGAIPAGAGAAAAGPGASIDNGMRRLEGLNADQLRTLVSIDRSLRGGRRADPGSRGALPFDGGGFSPERA